jgi:hypothetical protein
MKQAGPHTLFLTALFPGTLGNHASVTPNTRQTDAQTSHSLAAVVSPGAFKQVNDFTPAPAGPSSATQFTSFRIGFTASTQPHGFSHLRSAVSPVL